MVPGEERIVLQLQMNGFNDVQVKVVGPYVYLWARSRAKPPSSAPRAW